MGRKLERGLCALFWGGGAGSPSNTKSLGPRPTSILCGILIHPDIWPQQIWADNWGGCAPLGEGELGHHLTECGQGQGLHARSCLATIDMGQKLGALPPFWEGELGPHLTQCRLGRGLPVYQVASWSIEPFGHNRYGLKIGGCCVPLGEGELGPHLTQVQGRGQPACPGSSGSVQAFGPNTPTSPTDRTLCYVR